ncbi:amidase [Lamprobacter modestohalophilus]|uniref:amidase n=1 Tax=Lamprobacter modestohalophilus TaxID=1064514 RepID=UPI002ADEACE8|nr:amidase [Lamprobacter modestohalophilus]MEA1052075.1 amidase [Lamprobacter modestohalophilus]
MASAPVCPARADADLAKLRAALAAGTVSPEQLLQRALQRIKALDASGPTLNSLVAVDPRPVSGRVPGSVAGGAGSARQDKGAENGALSGIPVVVGDTIDVKDLPTTAGSATLRGHRPRADAAVVAALRDAGALPFAKGNTRELGLLPSRPGYSSAGGQTLNPYDLARVASGVAAAVAAGLAPVGIGSDGAGDLRSAAAQAGLVAIRPTRGSVSTHGALTMPLSLDAIGPLARSVDDAALVLAVLAGKDPEGTLSHPVNLANTNSGAEPEAEAGSDKLKGMRFGVFDALAGGNREVDQAFDQALRWLEGDAAEIVSLELPTGFEEGWPQWNALLRETELRDQLNAYLVQVGDGWPSHLEALLRMSESPLIRGSASPVDPAALAMLSRALEGPGLANPDYLEVLSVHLPALRLALLNRMAEHGLDALVFPTGLCPAPSRLDDYDTSYDCDAPDPNLPAGLAAASGLPEITIPMGQTARGLPVGLSFLGVPDSEPTLIGLGARFEQLRGAPPWPEAVPKPLQDTNSG